jgi:hypothetical protein
MTKKVAILYWGMTRSTRFVYETHHENIFNVLKAANIFFDVFMHTWHVEHGNIIWGNICHIPIEYEEYKLLEPTQYQIDSQDEFLKDLVFSDYYREGEGEWLPDLLRNHLCALESQKRVTELCLKSGVTYDAILYMRPDVLVLSKLDPQWLSIQPGQIRIPDTFHYGGYNDRFAIVHPESSRLYGCRIEQAKDYRMIHPRIAAEEYIKYILETSFSTIQEIRFNMVIVRPSAIVQEWSVLESDAEAMAILKDSGLELKHHSVN